MTYVTGGSGGTMVDLMGALKTFAEGEGWTIDKWDSTNKLLFMTKGICTVTMWGDTTRTVNVYTGASGSGTFSAVADHRIYFAMGTSNTAGLTTYYSHPGSPVTSAYDDDAPFINGMNGPFVAWHFFADSTVSDHIHVVVEISAGVFKHFSLGFVDKKGLTHAGVAYVTASPTTHWRNVSTYIGSVNGQFNDPGKQHYPFCLGNTDNSVPAQPAIYLNAPPIIVKNSDAWPAAWKGPVAGNSADGSNNQGTILGLISNSIVYSPNAWPSNVNTRGCLLDVVVVSEATPYSNIVPMFPIPVFRSHYNSGSGDSSRRICYVGDFPNVRAVNLSNLSPGQEVTYDTDTWMVFPTVKQTSWTDRQVTNEPQSGQLGLAYKKVA